MKKQTIIKIATLLLISLTLISCNPDNEGVFWRMSQSVPKVDVGAITLIAYDGTDLYARTTKKGPLQKYSGGNWSKISSAGARHFTTDSTYIYFLASAGETNKLSAYEISNGQIVELGNNETILSMTPTFNLVLLKDGSDYKVKKFDNADFDIKIFDNIFLSYDGVFSDEYSPNLILSNNSEFLVSGRKINPTTSYSHLLDNTMIELKSDDDSFYSYPIIAMGKDGNDIVLINTQGQIWLGKENDPTKFIKGNTISLTERNQDYVPYPTFIKGDYLYIQNSYYEFKKIEISSGDVENVDTEFAKVFSNSKIEAFSYLVYIDVGNDIYDVYVGTKDNGIYKIDALDADDKNWEADRY